MSWSPGRGRSWQSGAVREGVMVVTGDHSSVKALSSTAHSEKCSQGSRAWPRICGHGRRGHAGGPGPGHTGPCAGGRCGFCLTKKSH